MYCSLQMPRIARSISYKKGTQELEGRRIFNSALPANDCVRNGYKIRRISNNKL